MRFPPLSTPRLRIRDFRPDDVPFRRELTLGAFNADQSLEQTSDFVGWTMSSYRHLEALYQPPHGEYVVALADSTPIGAIGVQPQMVPWNVFDSKPPAVPLNYVEYSLFWAISPSYWRKGYASEAAAAFIAALFDQYGFARLVALTEFDNAASIGVMEKVGMSIMRNPLGYPSWFQVIGLIKHPG
ncbi:MAG: GNAT family N-acetyltransferase [Chloroflexi bacterium]|nr:GNAT family N-acetyltransferase [Chloroflexota bacterium]